MAIVIFFLASYCFLMNILQELVTFVLENIKISAGVPHGCLMDDMFCMSVLAGK
jgi:hypothetical protein